MRLLPQIPSLLRITPSPPRDGAAVRRRDALVEAAVALASEVADGGLDGVLHQVARAAAGITGAASALALVDAQGGLVRLVCEGMDRSTREALARPDVLPPLVQRLRDVGRPLTDDDLEGDIARRYAALAPHGFLAVPVRSSGFAVLLVLGVAGWAADDEQIAMASMLAMLAARALDGTHRLDTLRETCDALRRFAGEILERRDDQLRQAGRELHDGIGQRLAAANAQLQALEPLLEGGPSAARERFRDARALVVRTLGELRDLARELRPSVVEDFGFVQALRWHLRRLPAQAGGAPPLELDGPEIRMPVAVESALFKATEDILAGIVHGGEGRILHVRYRTSMGGITVEIVGRAARPLDLGAMRERLRPFSGSVRVGSVADSAIVITIEIPATADPAFRPAPLRFVN